MSKLVWREIIHVFTNSALNIVLKSIIKNMATVRIIDVMCHKFSRERCKYYISVVSILNTVNVFVQPI
jgi:hypothetical protein